MLNHMLWYIVIDFTETTHYLFELSNNPLIFKSVIYFSRYQDIC